VQSAGVQAADRNFEQALEILDQAVQVYSDSPELGEARTRVLGLKADFEWKQRNKRFQDSISDARLLLGSGKLAEARSAIDRIGSDFPDWPGLNQAVAPLRDELIQRQQQAEIAAFEQRAAELTREEQF